MLSSSSRWKDKHPDLVCMWLLGNEIMKISKQGRRLQSNTDNIITIIETKDKTPQPHKQLHTTHYRSQVRGVVLEMAQNLGTY